MTKKCTNFHGRYGDLISAIDQRKFDTEMDTEVELIIRPPKGFEDIYQSFIPSLPQKEKSEEEDDEETWASPLSEDNDGTIQDKIFERQLKNILRENQIQRHAGNKRDGDLDMKRLYKAYTTGRCFTDKDIISQKCYNIALVVDCSGSMRGDKANLAAKSAVRFIKHFQKLSALSVILFNCGITTVKKPTEILDDVAIRAIGQQIKNKTRDEYSYGNHDHTAIKKAIETLLPTKGRKIITVISDGQPACDKREKCEKVFSKECFQTDNEIQETKIAVTRALSQKCAIFGLGIMEESVRKIYPVSEIIYNIAELYPTLLMLLKVAIKRGAI